MKKIFTLLFSIMLISSQIVYSQNTENVKITGQVTDSKAQILPYANVLLTKTADTSLVKAALTDSIGKFEINGVEPSNYLIVTSMSGYLSNYYSLKIIGGSANINLPTIILAPDTKTLKGITIKYTRPFIQLQAGKLIVNVENSIVSTGGTALDVLKKTPEVNVNAQSDQISLKGKTGVLIMIDGRQTHLSSADVSNLLKSMPADNISKIEIITNPSSKYDAAGTSGIINIIMKKNMSYGTNGTFTLGGGYGKFGKYNTGFSLNHRSKKLNLYSSYNYSHNRSFNTDNLITKYLENKQLTASHETNNRDDYYTNYHTFNAGLDWSLGDHTSVGAEVNGYFYDNTDNASGNTAIFDSQHTLDSTLLGKSNSNSGRSIISGNVHFSHTFDSTGRKISLEGDYSVFNGKSNDYYTNSYQDNNGAETGNPFIIRDRLPISIDIKVAKVDYVQPFKKNIQLEVGIKTSEVTTDNNAHYEIYNGNDWGKDPTRTNEFKYKENIHAAYASLILPLNKTTFNAGLRIEQTISEGKSVSMDSTVKRNYTKLFPSLFIDHKFNEKNALQLSYSRRIDRPDYQDLNPFINFIDLYTYDQGNPFLQPVLTNSFELSYVYKNNYILSVGYEKDNGVITKVPQRMDSSKNIIRSMPQNLDYAQSYSLNLSANFDITNWWKVYSNAGLYYTKYSNDFSGVALNNNAIYTSLYITNSVQLPAKYKLEVSGNYLSSAPWGIFTQHPLYQVDAGLQKSFFSHKLDMKLSFNDIFNTGHTFLTSDFDGIQMQEKYKGESQKVYLTLSYKFGNNKIKSAKSANSASKEEINRIKTN